MHCFIVHFFTRLKILCFTLDNGEGLEDINILKQTMLRLHLHYGRDVRVILCLVSESIGEHAEQKGLHLLDYLPYLTYLNLGDGALKSLTEVCYYVV